MSPRCRHRPPPHARTPGRTGAGLLVLLASVLAGCAATTIVGPPKATPTDILGISEALRERGVLISGLVSGDAGCDDPDLIGTAIRFSASGAGQGTPATIRLYIFRNDASYQKLRPTVDACAAAWIADPATFEAIDSSPYVAVGQGPWAAGFRDAIRDALAEAAGDA